MRPIKLIISAFGPYAGRVELDMARLGTSGLYIIAGETGAGKTTVFDAISYALYGEASGDTRKAAMLRSKYAEPSTPTEVELTFLYGGKEYVVRRNPEYLRPAKRGGGETKEKAAAQLTLPDGRVVTQIKEVDGAVQQILGLTREQFSQIAMIAQGNFRELLLAGTEKRQMILRDIFGTGNYEKLRVMLVEETKTLRAEYKRKAESFEQFFAGVTCEPQSPLAGELELLQAMGDKVPAEQAVELTDQLVALDEMALAKLDGELQNARTRLDQSKELLAKGEKADRDRVQLTQAGQEQAQAAQAMEQACTHLREQESKKPETDGQMARAAQLEARMADYGALAELEAQAAKLAGEQAETERQQQRYESRVQQLKEEEAQLAELLAGLQNAGENKARLENEQSKCAQQREAVAELQAACAEREVLLAAARQAAAQVAEASAAQREASRAYNEGLTAYLSQQAGLLAEELQEGSPCPVCGSVHHPAPARRTAEAPTWEQVQKMSAAEKKAAETARRAGENCSSIKAQLAQKTADIADRLAQLMPSAPAAEAQAVLARREKELREHSRQLAAALEQEEKRVRQRDKAAEQLPDIRQRIEKGGKCLEENRQKLADLRAKHQSAVRQGTALREKLPFATHAQALQALQALQAACKAAEKELEQARAAVSEAARKQDLLAGSIAQLTRQLQQAPPQSTAELRQNCREAQQRVDTLDSARSSLSLRVEVNRKSLEQMRTTAKTALQTETRLKWMQALADTASGRLVEKERVMLEAYVQMELFERILRRANIRLKMMSDGQYSLVRAGAEGGSSKTGLELNVFDAYNGTQRSVKSLSGGESFLASLSLALGLSDEIRSSAGGIRLDTMFVDEGFGTLSAEYLDQAFRALNELSSSNCLVGVISHVDELKKRIDKQILVTKQRSGGSRAEICL